MRFQALAGIATGVLAFALAPQVQAAVTVLGNGSSHSCYEYAEFGGSSDDGVKACDVALEQETLTVKDRAATYINRGILKSRNGDSRGALRDYNQGLTIQGDLSEGYVDRGAVMILMGRYDEALSNLDKGIAMGTDRIQIAYYDRAIVREAMGNIRGAYEDYKKAAEIQPDFTLATEQLARFRVVHKTGDGS